MSGMNNLQANLCLLAVTLCWSTEVVIFSIIPDGVNPFATTCVTSLIGALLLGVCFARRIAAAFRSDRMKLLRRVAVLSALNTAYSVLFLIGLDDFGVSDGAFTICITAVVLPVMLLMMHRGVGARTWVSAGCVLAGIVIAMIPTLEASQLDGLAVMVVGCIVRAVYIVKLNDWAREHDPLAVAAGVSTGIAVFAFVPWLVMQPATFAALPWSAELIAAYFIYGYFVVAFTIALNTLAQRRATPAQATIVYSTEIVFSVIWATCLPASIVDPVELSAPLVIGCALIVVGNLVEIVPSRKGEDEAADEAMVEAAAGVDEAQQVDGGPTRIGATTSDRAAVADVVTEILARIRRPEVRKVVLFAILLAMYLVIALPFKVMNIIPGFADVRPVDMLQPVYGIFFGIPGCLAFAVGNLIGDILSDSLRWSSIAGFVANFAYPYLMYLIWTKLRSQPFSLRSGRTILLFALTIIACACLKALIIIPAVALIYPEVDAALFALTVILNGALFPIGFAIPFIIMLQEELGFKPLGRTRRFIGKESLG